eukprot:TRINITY_DN6658_c0_g2_i2.p1 TRINITY_DN6658_c0_g2~~TRINITY_DN6658_c0_g2_i2.p1  ORF type:complete len:552 (-),score=122.77 TRINITY_DN6658_c0_g2_i2:341-1996(-)
MLRSLVGSEMCIRDSSKQQGCGGYELIRQMSAPLQGPADAQRAIVERAIVERAKLVRRASQLARAAGILHDGCKFVRASSMHAPKDALSKTEGKLTSGADYESDASPAGLEVFLGGTCAESKWRTNTAIPVLNQARVSFYNPQLGPGEWTEKMVAVEAEAKQNAVCNLFVITAESTSIASMVEAAELISSRQNVVLCLQEYNGQGPESKDVRRGRTYLHDLAERHCCQVFSSVLDAANEAVRRICEHRLPPMIRQRSWVDETGQPLKEHSPESPWLSTPAMSEEEAWTHFYQVLRLQLKGGRLSNLVAGQAPNLYLAMGYATQGYDRFEEVREHLEEWCCMNDERHRADGTGWILATHGDADYGHSSIETIAQHVRARGTPVVFLQSDFAYCEPGSEYWPTYASAGLFGAGKSHGIAKTTKQGEAVLDTHGKPVMLPAWGGYVKDAQGQRTPELAFPDQAMLQPRPGGNLLVYHLAGIFVAGGGDITAEQAELYGLQSGARVGDFFVPASARDGTCSRLNGIYLPGAICKQQTRMRNPAMTRLELLGHHAA